MRSWYLRCAVIIAFCFAILRVENAVAQPGYSTALPSEVSATGDTWSWIAPDTARLTVLLEETGASAIEAKDGVDRTTSKLQNAIQKLGKAVVQVRTESFSGADVPGSPVRRSAAVQLQRFVGIETTELDKTASFIDAALNVGASSVSDVSYSVKEDNASHLAAIALATKKAHAKAVSIAKALNAKLGSLISASISEEPAGRVLRMKQQLGRDLGNFSDRDMHIYVTLRYGIVEN